VYEAARFLACLARSWLAPRSACSRDFGTAEVHFWRHDSPAPGSRRLHYHSRRFREHRCDLPRSYGGTTQARQGGDQTDSRRGRDVYVSETPHNNFQATIEVPRHSNLWARLSAGELVVEDVEGDKNLEVLAGRIQVDVPHAEQYGHRDASVTAGSIESSAFDVSKGGLFRSFEQHGPGKYRLHAHVMTGEIDLRGSD